MNNEQISIEKSTSANNGKHMQPMKYDTILSYHEASINELKFVDVDSRYYLQSIHPYLCFPAFVEPVC